MELSERLAGLPEPMRVELERRRPDFTLRVLAVWDRAGEQGRAEIANVFASGVPDMLRGFWLEG